LSYADDDRKRHAWSATNPGNAAIREELFAAVSQWIPEHGRILDAGRGTGWLLSRLAEGGVPTRRLAGLELIPASAAAASA
jgi:2-polyprenyl-3-methyl-5-hydroxy-6-metoxy-1,4-benzoquinol methylase